jgi:hypothetical protein
MENLKLLPALGNVWLRQVLRNVGIKLHLTRRHKPEDLVLKGIKNMKYIDVGV